jgi:hypothetical protein
VAELRNSCFSLSITTRPTKSVTSVGVKMSWRVTLRHHLVGGYPSAKTLGYLIKTHAESSVPVTCRCFFRGDRVRLGSIVFFIAAVMVSSWTLSAHSCLVVT